MRTLTCTRQPCWKRYSQMRTLHDMYFVYQVENFTHKRLFWHQWRVLVYQVTTFTPKWSLDMHVIDKLKTLLSFTCICLQSGQDYSQLRKLTCIKLHLSTKSETLLSNDNFDMYLSTKWQNLLSIEKADMHLSTKSETLLSNENFDMYLSTKWQKLLSIEKAYMYLSTNVYRWRLKPYSQMRTLTCICLPNWKFYSKKRTLTCIFVYEIENFTFKWELWHLFVYTWRYQYWGLQKFFYYIYGGSPKVTCWIICTRLTNPLKRGASESTGIFEGICLPISRWLFVHYKNLIRRFWELSLEAAKWQSYYFWNAW